MHRALGAFQLIRVSIFKGEARAAVLHQNAKLVRRDARAKSVEDRIDQRNCHPITVNNCNVNRILMDLLGQLCRGSHCFFGVNKACQFLGRFGRQHVRQTRCMISISQKAVARIIGQLGGLGFNMHPLCAPRIHPGHIKFRQHVQHQQRCCTLTVWRMFDNFDIFVGPRHRIGRGAGDRRKIIGGMRGPQRRQRRNHVLGNLTPVECITSVFRYAAQHLCLTRRAEHLPHRRNLAVHQIIFPPRFCQLFGFFRPVKRNTRCNGHTCVCIMNGWGQNGIQTYLANRFRQMTERINRTRNRHGMR